MFKWLFAAFLIIPLLEIYLLLTVGGWIGILPTVALVIFTALLGVVLIRIQGFLTVVRLQEKLRRGEPPAEELLTGAALLVAGALLLTPGFFTDTIGFLLLTPAVRRGLLAHGIRKWLIRHRVYPAHKKDGPEVIEGNYKRDD